MMKTKPPSRQLECHRRFAELAVYEQATRSDWEELLLLVHALPASADRTWLQDQVLEHLQALFGSTA